MSDSEDESYTDQPVRGRRRKVYIDDSDASTDEDDSIPLPSRKTRRLHRLVRKNRDDSDQDEKPETKPRRSSHSSTRKVSGKHKDASGRSLLQRCCAKGNYEEAKQLVEEGADVNESDYAGNTPLHEAALEGYTEIARLLLDHGADMNKQSGQMDRDTALIDAATNQHYGVVALLIEKGADPVLVNAQGETALSALESGADSGDTPILEYHQTKKQLTQYTKDWRKNHPEQPAPESVSDDTATRRFKENLFVDFLTKEGRSEIYSKVADNDVTYVLNYISNLPDQKLPQDLLLLAARHGHTDIASLLVAFGADVDHCDHNGRTPLMYAAGKEHIDMMKFLMEANADAYAQDDDGMTALDYAKHANVEDDEEVKLLEDYLSKTTPKKKKKTESKKKAAKSKTVKKESKKAKKPKVREAKKEVVKEAKKEVKETKKVKEVKKEVRVEPEVEPVAPKARVASEPKLKRKKFVERIVSLNRPTPREDRSQSPMAVEDGLKKKPELKKQESAEKPTEQVKQQETKPEVAKPALDKQETNKKRRHQLEVERLERKRARQEQIAKRIEQIEKQREAEEKAKKAEEQERLRLEREAEEERRNAAEAKKLAAIREQQKARRKVVRSFYPYAIRQIQFDHLPLEAEMDKFLPVYVFKINGQNYIADVQACIVLGVENLSEKYPKMTHIAATKEQKKVMWNVLWPMIGSFVDDSADSSPKSLWELYEDEGSKFDKLMLEFVKEQDFLNILKSDKDLAEVYGATKENFCPVAIQGLPKRQTETALVSARSAQDIQPSQKRLDLPFILARKLQFASSMDKHMW